MLSEPGWMAARTILRQRGRNGHPPEHAEALRHFFEPSAERSRNGQPPEALRSQLGFGMVAERSQKGQRPEQNAVIRDKTE
jgi:hypothetical protein